MTVRSTGFGWLETDAGRFEHDVVVFPDGRVADRYDHLRGDNHRFGAEEAETVLAGTRARVVVGTGQDGMVRVAADARRLLAGLGVELHVAPTPEAVRTYNRLPEPKCAVFHLTC